nr:hypothetical protein CTI12_AA418620 [Tanacetum cinerariifolium]
MLEDQSNSAMDTNPSQPLASARVVDGLHKKPQQETVGPTSLGVTSKEGADPQLSSRHDALADCTAEVDLGKSAPNDFISKQQDKTKSTRDGSTFPNVAQLTELLVKSLQPELSKPLSSHDLNSSLPTELKELPSKLNTLTGEVKELKKHVDELDIELPGDLKEIPNKLDTFTLTVSSLTTQVAELKTLYLPKSSSQPKGELIRKDKGKEDMSSKDVEEENTGDSDDDDTINLTGSMVESSKKKKLNKFDFVTKQVDHESKCPNFKNGICKSFDRAILVQRTKPIITMLEDIKLYIMQRLVAMNRVARTWEHSITPSINKRLELLKEKQRDWMVIPSGFHELKVRKELLEGLKEEWEGVREAKEGVIEVGEGVREAEEGEEMTKDEIRKNLEQEVWDVNAATGRYLSTDLLEYAHVIINNIRLETCANLMGLQLLQLELILGKTPSRSFRPVNQLKFYGTFGHQVHLGFHLLMMVLEASGSPPCGCVVNP